MVWDYNYILFKLIKLKSCKTQREYCNYNKIPEDEPSVRIAQSNSEMEINPLSEFHLHFFKKHLHILKKRIVIIVARDIATDRLLIVLRREHAQMFNGKYDLSVICFKLYQLKLLIIAMN